MARVPSDRSTSAATAARSTDFPRRWNSDWTHADRSAGPRDRHETWRPEADSGMDGAFSEGRDATRTALGDGAAAYAFTSSRWLWTKLPSSTRTTSFLPAKNPGV